jgi:5'-3' exoribonuclease 1
MDYIRWYKASDEYRKETRHCIYGQDADLIMLSLLSHEPNFTIIREEVKYKREQVEGIVRNEFIITNNFQLLYLPILRQYLDLEFKSTIQATKIEYNLERVIDDIIFFCFFVGNDFLPSLSVLDIAEASVDTLFEIYKVTIPEIGDYVTENGLIYWDRAELLIKALATHELAILHSRMQKIMNFEKRADDQEAQFFKGVERIHYFRLKDKQAKMVGEKKQNLLDRLVKDGKDKEYKNNLKSNRPRELVKMKLEVKNNQKALKKRRANNPNEFKSNNKKLDFGVLLDQNKGDSDEEDVNWLDEDYRQDAEDDEEAVEKNEAPEREVKLNVEETKTSPTEDTHEETVDTNKISEEEKGFHQWQEGDDFSDLCLKDFNDSDVSEVDIEELMNIEEGIQGSLTKDMIVQLKLAEDSRKKNQSFVKNLCERYKENPASAKAYYYKEKVNFDVYTHDGKEDRDEMLRQYLIGMQWVMFYYYKGVQHWGFYYKYHYPPMISDIREIESLLKSTTIENFDMCEGENRPFKPFEQLLTILPADSIQNLLPKCYYDNFIKNPAFEKFYPLTFDMDLNGRSMPWEAIVLIPFIQENQLLQHQKNLADEGKLIMEQKDIDRNSRGDQKLYFKERTLSSYPAPKAEFKGFSFGDKNRCKITKIEDVNENLIGAHSIDYKTTDTSIVCDFPSLDSLDIYKMALQTKNMRGAKFEIPQIFIDDQWTENFDVGKLAKEVVSRERECIYIDYPFKREAFVYCIMTYDSYYNVYDSWTSGSTKHLISETSEQQWSEGSFCSARNLEKMNLHCPKINVIVGFNRVNKITWNGRTNSYEKSYKNDVEYLPLQMISFDRNEDHYLNLEPRVHDPLVRFEPMKKCMVCDETYFGLCAQIKQVSEGGVVNEHFKYYDVTINKKIEERKIRDLFFAKNLIKNRMIHETKYSSIDHIAKRNSKSYQLVNRITSSIFIKYNDENKEKKTADIGLKLRNNNQKVHIPMDVVYSEKIVPYKTEPVQFWGFSDLAENTIMDYLYTFPWLENYIEARAHYEQSMRNVKYNKNDNRMNTLEDAMPFFESDEERLEELKRLTDWIAGCELSSRSFVPAGFRFLSTEARNDIEEALVDMKKEEQAAIPSELIKVDPRTIFAEMFPFWCPPVPLTNKNFRFGDRVININTTNRKYIPFGEIGTVIGLTLDGVIVRFDEPNVSLTDVHDTCPAYTGAVVDPESMMNLTYQAEMKHQNKKQQNVRHVPHKGEHTQNYRQGGGDNKEYKGGPKFPKKEKEEQKQGGPTRFAKFDPKKKHNKPKQHMGEW